MKPYRLVIVVPYRDREEHLQEFLDRFVEYMQTHQPGIDYVMYVIEQDDHLPFRRGTLCNIGTHIAKRTKATHVCMHDVDLLPEQGCDYSASKHPTHLSPHCSQNDYALPFEFEFGGVVLFPLKVFERVNGFSNLYEGWGCEAEDLRERCDQSKVEVRRRPGQYRSLPHPPANLRAGAEEWQRNGTRLTALRGHQIQPGDDGFAQLQREFVYNITNTTVLRKDVVVVKYSVQFWRHGEPRPSNLQAARPFNHTDMPRDVQGREWPALLSNARFITADEPTWREFCTEMGPWAATVKHVPACLPVNVPQDTGNALSPDEVARWKSHRLLWQHLLDATHLEHIFVIEDDVRIRFSDLEQHRLLSSALNNLTYCMRNWDVLYISHSCTQILGHVAKLLAVPKGACGLSAYVMSRRAALILMGNSNTYDEPVDVMVDRLVEARRLDALVVFPTPVFTV
jgi:hypothetical protein